MERNVTNKVRAILVRNGKIAVIKTKSSGAFMLPGGKIDDGETAKDTLTREILEETGIEIEGIQIEGPFFQNEKEYETNDDQGNVIKKETHTSFYLVNTQKDFNPSKIKLTEREKARGSKPYWVNPTKLEYYLSTRKKSLKSSYARRYATEFLNVYMKYEQFQKRKGRKKIYVQNNYSRQYKIYWSK